MNDCTVSALTVEVKTGPKIATAAQNFSVEAYEKIDLTVPGVDPKDKTKPGTGTAVVLPSGSTPQFVMITSSAYGSGLTFTPGSSGKTPIILDQPLLLSGGAVSLLPGLDTISVSNNTGQNATVTILVGRTAQPPAQTSGTGSGSGTSGGGGKSGGGTTPPPSS